MNFTLPSPAILRPQTPLRSITPPQGTALAELDENSLLIGRTVAYEMLAAINR